MKVDSSLFQLLSDGYGQTISEYSNALGDGLWGIDYNRGQILVFDNGLRYTKDGSSTEIHYSEVVGIKSAMTIEIISKAQSEDMGFLIMRFECGLATYDLLFPIEIYSSLLGYFCGQIEQFQKRVVATGFIT